MKDRDAVRWWLAAYERAWRASGTAALAGLLSPDASYLSAPYEEAVVGLAAIARMWERERDGPGEVFTLATEVLAVDGAVAVVRAEVRYGPGARTPLAIRRSSRAVPGGPGRPASSLTCPRRDG